MGKIPQAKVKGESRIAPNNIIVENKHKKVLFSFEAIEKMNILIWMEHVKIGLPIYLIQCKKYRG